MKKGNALKKKKKNGLAEFFPRIDIGEATLMQIF